MSRTQKSPDMSLSGQKLASRFALTMSLVLAVVMVIAGAFLYSRVLSAAQQVQENTFVEATRLQGPLLVQMRQDWEDEKNKAVFGKEPPVRENRLQTPVQIKDKEVDTSGKVNSWSFGYRYQVLIGYRFGHKK